MTKHIVVLERDQSSFLQTTSLPEFSPDDLPKGWQGLGVEASGVTLFILKVAPGADEFTIHSSEDAWLGYVISGAGSLHVGDSAMEKTDETPFEAGDFITFDANTPHGWKNGNSESKILFSKKT